MKRSRFKRATATTEIELTERDTAILLALEKYRFLTTEHLMVLAETDSKQSLNRRLRRLFDAKYVDRPRAQMHAMAYGEKRPMVYALGNAGADLLSNRFQMRLPDIYWTEKNRRIKEKFIEHTLGIADFMVAMEQACKEAGNIQIITRDDILTNAPERTRRAKHPFRWQTRVSFNGERHEIAIVPDEVFGLHYLEKPEGKNRAYFFVEIDRGTMPITRRDIRQTSFARKLMSYADTYERKLHTERFGIKNFRALTLTTSQARINTMQHAWKIEVSDRAPAGMFLFAEKGSDGHSWWSAGNEAATLT
ncbi:MAG: replication-relaxation family protein [Pseudomonadota bacterium]